MTVKEIIEAIDELFGDTSVSKQVTLAWMEEIFGHVGTNVDAIKEDIEADGLLEESGE